MSILPIRGDRSSAIADRPFRVIHPGGFVSYHRNYAAASCAAWRTYGKPAGIHRVDADGKIMPALADGDTFHIGPWAYRLRTAEIKATGSDGTPLVGNVSHVAPLEIIVCPQANEEIRLETILILLRQCWIYRCGRPRTAEEECNQAATYVASAMDDLHRIGTESILRKTKGGERHA
jgi:hypothetical protein